MPWRCMVSWNVSFDCGFRNFTQFPASMFYPPTGELVWVDQIIPGPANIPNSPLFYATKCAGAVPTKNLPDEKVNTCNVMFAGRNPKDAPSLNTPCQSSKLSVVCELDLDGERYNFNPDYIQ